MRISHCQVPATEPSLDEARASIRRAIADFIKRRRESKIEVYERRPSGRVVRR